MFSFAAYFCHSNTYLHTIVIIGEIKQHTKQISFCIVYEYDFPRNCKQKKFLRKVKTFVICLTFFTAFIYLYCEIFHKYSEHK